VVKVGCSGKSDKRNLQKTIHPLYIFINSVLSCILLPIKAK